MNEIYDSLIRFAPSIKMIFEVAEEPKEENFYELTEEILSQSNLQGMVSEEELYLWIPNNVKVSGEEVIVVTKNEKEELLKGKKVVEGLCKMAGETFENFHDKLSFTSKLLPKEFVENSKFSQAI